MANQSGKKKGGGGFLIFIIVFTLGIIRSVADSDIIIGLLAIFVPIIVFILVFRAIIRSARKGRNTIEQRKAYEKKKTDDKKRRTGEEVFASSAPQTSCANPEPHRHYETATRTQQTQQSKDSRKENLDTLLSAGLITREEYHDMLRRVR